MKGEDLVLGSFKTLSLDCPNFPLISAVVASWCTRSRPGPGDIYLHLLPEFEPSPADELHLVLLMKDIRRTLNR